MMSRRLLAALALAVTAIGGCVHTQKSSEIMRWQDRPAEAEALYLQRFNAMVQSRGAFRYDTMAPLSGAATPVALTKRQVSDAFAEDAVEEAADYAANANSTAFLVWQDGALVEERYFGETEANTPLVSKSLSKPVSAIAIGRAIQLGKIDSLDQPVSDFVTEWQGTPKAVMTMRHMLTMHSGLLEQSFAMEAENHWGRAYLDPYNGRYILDEYPLTETPGERYSYSNATGDLVAIVIERATGQQYEDFLGQELLAPIGAAGGSIWLNREGGLAHSGCCMFLPAQTYMKLAVLLLDDGRVGDMQLLPAGYVDEMRTPSTDNPYYGLGVWLGSPYAERRGFMGQRSEAPKIRHSAPYLADDVFLFDGNANQVVYIIPSTKTVILRLGNNPPKELDWDNSFLPNTLLAGLKK